MTNSLAEEAAACRAQAAEFAGKPEQPFLLRLSEAFDELAREQSWTSSPARPRSANAEPQPRKQLTEA